LKSRDILSHRIRFFSECGDIYCWGWNESGQLGLPCKTVKEKRQTVSKENELHKMFHADMDKEQESVLQILNEESAYESKWQIAASSETEHEMCSSGTQNVQRPHASLDKYESLLFVQNTDPVQVQSFPCLIDLKDQFIIQRASCGSRHTALLTGNFSL
jgi:alpha-tubulin suppressor-like RCC1 family protein